MSDIITYSMLGKNDEKTSNSASPIISHNYLINKKQSRKFILTCMGFTLSTIMVFTGHASFKDWSDFNKWGFALYATSNVIPKLNLNLNSNRII